MCRVYPNHGNSAKIAKPDPCCIRYVKFSGSVLSNPKNAPFIEAYFFLLSYGFIFFLSLILTLIERSEGTPVFFNKIKRRP